MRGRRQEGASKYLLTLSLYAALRQDDSAWHSLSHIITQSALFPCDILAGSIIYHSELAFLSPLSHFSFSLTLSALVLYSLVKFSLINCDSAIF